MEEALLPWHPRKNSDESIKLYFNIESEQHGILYRIRLKRNQHLFSRNVAKNLHHLRQDMNCLFSGSIVGDDQSSVGMNLCNGMVNIYIYPRDSDLQSYQHRTIKYVLFLQ